MDRASLDERLSQISTQWTLLFAAHADPDDSGRAALAQLLQRYCDAIYRYLLAAVRDPDAAADLTQEFALRFLRGDFQRASPDRGRFRSYLKTALFNLVADYRRAQKAAGRALADDVADERRGPADSAEDDQFMSSWRETLIDRTWNTLQNFNATYHAALKLRVANPDMRSAAMAEQITAELGKPVNAAAARKAVQRGHEKFADVLLDEIAQTLDDPDVEELEAELRAVDLLRYCKSALQRRRQREMRSSGSPAIGG